MAGYVFSCAFCRFYGRSGACLNVKNKGRSNGSRIGGHWSAADDAAGIVLAEVVLTPTETIALSHSLWVEIFGDVPEEVVFQ